MSENPNEGPRGKNRYVWPERVWRLRVACEGCRRFAFGTYPTTAAAMQQMDGLREMGWKIGLVQCFCDRCAKEGKG